jgi:hypothetical protein
MIISRFYSLYNINESVRIDIDEVNNLKDDKLFVLVIDRNKSNSICKKYIDLPIMNDRFSIRIKGKKSFMHVDDCVAVNVLKSKLSSAKEHGFTTVVVSNDQPTRSLETFIDFIVYI